jgi:hypothetical protein
MSSRAAEVRDAYRCSRGTILRLWPASWLVLAGAIYVAQGRAIHEALIQIAVVADSVTCYERVTTGE